MKVNNDSGSSGERNWNSPNLNDFGYETKPRVPEKAKRADRRGDLFDSSAR